MNKTIKILLCILIICSTMLLGWYVGKDILNKEDSKSSSINNNSNQKSSQQVENTKNDSNPEKTTNQSNSKYNQYLGYWYESKDHYKDYNPSSLNIKKVNDKEMILDLYISRIANFDDVKVNLSDYTFEATSDNGLSNNGEVAKITGKLVIYDDEIIVKIKT